MRPTCLILIPALLLVITLAANAQDLAGLEEGIKPYGAYQGGDIDSVSMSNGHLSVHIPLISFPQRGGKLHLGFSVDYANPMYKLISTYLQHNPPSCTIPPCYNWQLAYTAGNGALTIKSDYPNLGLYNPSPGVEYLTNVQEADGAKHQVAAIANSSSGAMISLDASGYLAYWGGYEGSAYITDREGTNYFFNGYLGLGNIEDTNGNLITGNIDPNNSSNVLSYTDTMGRAIPNWPLTGTPISQCPNQGVAGNGLLAVTSASTWSFPGPNGGTATFVVCYASFTLNYPLCGTMTSCAGLAGAITQIQSIVLPNATSWNFAFDNTGALSRITLPTGGTISYTWGQNYYCVGTPTGDVVSQFTATATSRTVTDSTGTHTWDYNLSPLTTGNSSPTAQMIVTDPYGNDAVHTLTELATSGSCSYYETELDQYTGSHTNGTLLKKTVTNYNAQFYQGNNNTSANNVVPTSIVTTDVPASRSSTITKTWDSGVTLAGNQGLNAIYGDMLSESDYDFSGLLLRSTSNKYMALSGPNASSYLANNLLDLPYTVQVTGTSGGSYNTYGYDESTLVSSGITEQKTTGESYPGNQTSLHRSLNTNTAGTSTCNAISNGYAVTTNVFYNTGMVQKVTDPCGNSTTDQYSNTYYGAYPTTVTNALSQSTNYLYDFNTGSVTSIKDPNSQTTTKTYDIMDRLLSVSYPDGGSTKYCYTDGVTTACATGNAGKAPFAVVVTKAITSSTNEISTATLDGLARLSQTQLNSDPSGTTYTLTTYDALGRKYQVYNPTRCSSITTNCKNETTWGATTNNYDALNRITSITEQDGSIMKATYDQTNTKSTGVCSTVTDEAGNARQSCVDGLGRMTGVFEAPSGVDYETDYAYDALSNLLSVTQKGSNSADARIRTFQYDSLSRLTSASNPESNPASSPILYAYDADGNVITKTAPLPNQTETATVITTYTYDKLNRLTSKGYSDGVTLSDNYYYDTSPSWAGGLTNLVGRLVWSDNQYGGVAGKGTLNVYSYDAMGRVILQVEDSPSTSPGGLFLDYAYDLAGNLTSDTLYCTNTSTPSCPSADFPASTITYGPYDGASRLTTVTSSLDDAQHPPTLYSVNSSLGYWPTGAVREALFGNGLTETQAFNNRLQPCRINVNSAAAYFSQCTDATPSGNILDFTVGYNAGSTDNGNVVSWSGVGNQTFSRSYVYDSLNRLQSMSDSATSQACQGMSWTIDAWGNMTNQTGTKGTCFNFSSAVGTNNQLQSGYTYDAAGNMTYDGSHHYTYDAENRIIQVDSGSTASYVYNENGKRVRKNTGSAWTEYVYGPNGLVQAEWNGSSWPVQYVYAGNDLIAEYTSSTTEFIHADHLGSTRLVTSVTGTVLDSMDYLPFGQQVAGDTVTTHKFTGKERDSESGLDNFINRYYGSTMGRFMQPDEPFAGQEPTDPQSLNLYSYVRNSPTVSVDPDGLDCIYINNDTGQLTGFAGGGADCDNSNEASANSGYYVNGNVSTIYENSFGQVTGYSGTGDQPGTLIAGSLSPTNPDVPLNSFAQGVFSQPVIGYAQGTANNYIAPPLLTFLMAAVPGALSAGGPEITSLGIAGGPGTLVIGKLADLEGGVRPGERTLDLPDQGNPKSNWAQNSSRLREAMNEGNPIRDASAGNPGSNTGFLRAERNLLQNNGWTLQGDYWYPPGR